MSISRRGSLAAAPGSEYSQRGAEIHRDPYHPTANPRGWLDLSVAENNLSLPAVAAALAAAPAPPPSELRYAAMHGSGAARAAVAAYLARHHTHHRVEPDALVLAGSVGSLVDGLAAVTCNPGEAFITFSPGYRGHRAHLAARSGVRLVTAPLDVAVPSARRGRGLANGGGAMQAPEPDLRIGVAALQAAWERQGGDESGVRVVLVNSPHNPTGEVLSAGTVTDLIGWARDRGMHIIFDEVYANCVHDASHVFRSAADVLHGDLGDDVHILWSVSKDFCAAGVRLAVLHSQSAPVLAAMRSLALFAAPSRQAQWVVSHLLQDHDWTARFIEDNNVQLCMAFNRCAAFLESLHIPFITPAAGFFILADFRKWMAADSKDAEMALWRRMCDCKLYLLPGQECFGRRYGYFRVCFAAVNARAMEVAFRRFSCLLRHKIKARQL